MSWTVALTLLSLVPLEPVETPAIIGWDKVAHAAAYGLLAFFLLRLLALWPATVGWRWWGALLASSLYGGLVELLQHWLASGRHADLFDLCANVLGAALVCAVFRHRTAAGWLEPARPSRDHG